MTANSRTITRRRHAALRQTRWGPTRGRAAARWRSWGWLLLALGLSLALRWPLLSLPMISDEGGYAYVAQRWLDGTGRLYHDLWVSRPQGIFVAYGLIFETLGTDIVALRLGAWVAVAGTLVLVWRFAGAWAGPRAAAVAAVVFAIISASPTVEGFTANAEVFMGLPAAGAALLLLRASRAGWGAWPLLAAGGCAGLATLLKPSGIVMVGVGVAFVWLAGGTEARDALRRVGLVVAGFVAALVPALVHGWWVGWDEFVYASLTYRLTSQSGATATFDRQIGGISLLITRSGLELTVLALALVARHGRLPRLAGWRGDLNRRWAEASRVGIVAWTAGMGRRVEAGTLLVQLWLLGALVGVAVGGDWWPHYLIQVAAPFAIWVAWLVAGAWPRLHGWHRPALVALGLLLLLGPYRVVAKGDVDEMAVAIFDQPEYPIQDEVAAYLREHVPPDASIFVGFDHPSVYYLAERRAAYRHLYDAELLAIPGSHEALLDLIEGPDRPRYIVGIRERAPYPDHGEAFWAAVLRRYHIVDWVRGVPILREDDGLGRGR